MVDETAAYNNDTLLLKPMSANVGICRVMSLYTNDLKRDFAPCITANDCHILTFYRGKSARKVSEHR